MITGQAKIDFEKWFRGSIMGPRNFRFKIDTSTKRNGTKLLWLGLGDFYDLPQCMQDSAYREFFRTSKLMPVQICNQLKNLNETYNKLYEISN